MRSGKGDVVDRAMQVVGVLLLVALVGAVIWYRQMIANAPSDANVRVKVERSLELKAQGLAQQTENVLRSRAHEGGDHDDVAYAVMSVASNDTFIQVLQRPDEDVVVVIEDRLSEGGGLFSGDASLYGCGRLTVEWNTEPMVMWQPVSCPVDLDRQVSRRPRGHEVTIQP